MISPEILRGIAWMSFAALLYASAGGVVRLLSPDYSTFQLVFFRNVVGLVVLIPMLLRAGVPGLATRRPGMHLTRALFSWIGTMALFFAIANMPIADVFALAFTQPLMAMVLAIVVLGQAASAKSWIAGTVGFAGALVILRPGFGEVGFAALVALTSAFTYACATTAIKSLTETESIVAVTLYVNLMMLPLSAVAAVFDWTTPALADLPALFALGLIYTGAQYAFAKGIAAADARITQPFDFLRLPFAALIGWALFQELPDGWTWAGALIIFLASTYALRAETRVTSR